MNSKANKFQEMEKFIDMGAKNNYNNSRGVLKKADSEEDKKNIIYGIDWYNRVYKNKKGVSA